MMSKKDCTDCPVLIIGFGIAGIVQCHTFLANGFTNVTVVEVNDSFGGVWHLEKQYPGMQAQNTKLNFEFPEMRHNPDNYDDFPTQEQVHQYLKEYIEKYNLEKNVQYKTRVKSLSRYMVNDDEYKFKVVFDKQVGGSLEKTYDFVVCATGFTSTPNVPSCLRDPPREVTVLHSSEIRQHLHKVSSFGKGQLVAVVGSGKSALDCANWAVNAGAASVDLILPKAPFAVPLYQHPSGDKVKGFVEYNRLFCRALSWLMPCEPEAVRVRGVLPRMLYFFQSTWLGQIIRNFAWSMKFQEFAMISGTPPELISHTKDQPYTENSRHMCALPEGFISHVKEGKIRIRLGAKATGFSNENGQLVVLTRDKNTKDGTEESSFDSSMHYDIVLCATGFKNSLDFLSEGIQEHLYNHHGQMQIYRGVYCPFLPQMALLGLHQNLNSMFCSAIGARWITELAKGTAGCLVPSLDQEAVMSAMEAGLAFERRQYDETKNLTTPPGYYTTGWHYCPYADCMLGDLGATRIWRSPHGILDNIVGTVLPAHYEGIITEKFE